MAKKARQRIAYVLENAKSSAGGHRLGVNGLAVDADDGILYSGGRDGIVCAWDLNLQTQASRHDASAHRHKSNTRLRAQTQAHTHWINDIVLAQNRTALVSASSDLTVKVWRPHSEEDSSRANTIGEHADYVKCVATPPADVNANWVASGGLDRKISLWDLNGAGKTLEVDVKGEEITEKGSVYALAVGRNILASGGPEKMVRLYDPRTGIKVSKLVGHLDNIRSILIDDAGDIILSAGADKTIKMWSVRGGRCMYTFTMHDESIWSLYSDDPRLGVFYSSDRSGLVAKTDVRGGLEDLDDGLSLAIVQENFGVSKVVAAGGNLWTATNRSSINRWADIDIREGVELPELVWRPGEGTSAVASGGTMLPDPGSTDVPKKTRVSPGSILRISSTALLPRQSTLDSSQVTPGETMSRRASVVIQDEPDLEIIPVHPAPEETIEGHFGLLKHKMLNDRRRVLTLDTAGDVLLWDLIACKPIQSFGKRHLEEVEKSVNTREAVAPWCSVDLSSGNLTVVLEPFNCFDAEIYADELKLDETIEFKEDQRVILGRWILRYLFANLIDEEIKRDAVHRQSLNEEMERRQNSRLANAPASLDLSRPVSPGWQESEQVLTPRPIATHLPLPTPGLAIGLATPGAPGSVVVGRQESAVAERGQSGDGEDYFAAERVIRPPVTPGTDTSDMRASHENGVDKGRDKDKDKAADKGLDNGKSPGTPFSRKFRMSFSSKKLRSLSQATQEKPVVIKDGTEESESSSNHEKEIEDNLWGVLQKIRNDYDKQAIERPDKIIETSITPSLSAETPVLKLPPGTRVIIQEETSGGSANLYQGTIADIGRDVDIIEQKAPMWLGDVLLRNYIPPKEQIKVSFVLYPMDNLPPISPMDGTNRLNANRMLRVKKILAYVAERIEERTSKSNGSPAEDYLELYCNDQLLGLTMSLATIRAHVWKGGNDVVMHYKAKDRKDAQTFNQHPPPVVPAEEGGEQPAAKLPVSEAGLAQPAHGD